MYKLKVPFLVMRIKGAVYYAEVHKENAPDCMLMYPVTAMPDRAEFMTKVQDFCNGNTKRLGELVEEYMTMPLVRIEGYGSLLPDIGDIVVTVEAKEVEVT